MGTGSSLRPKPAEYWRADEVDVKVLAVTERVSSGSSVRAAVLWICDLAANLLGGDAGACLGDVSVDTSRSEDIRKKSSL